MTTDSIGSVIGPRGLLATPSYLRLWFAGGVGNAMRWLELLVAGIFTYDMTQSALMVALVTAARTLPMLLIGAFAGVIGEALNRKFPLLLQLSVASASSVAVCLLDFAGVAQVWHVALAGLVGGVVWATELAVRRRMIGEVVAIGHVGAAVALDSLTGSVARMIGPFVGGVVYETLGLGGAYLLSAVLYLMAVRVVSRLEFHQETRKLRFGRIAGDIAEGAATARANPAILAVVLVSIINNMLGFCYSALIPPIGLAGYGVTPTLVGALAAAEPLGAIISGVALSAGWIRIDGARALLRGSFLFFLGLVAFALAPWYALAFVILVVGGLGTAAFSIMQTTLVLTEAPPALRSRVMGLVTMCIGTGPLGVVAIGVLSEQLGAPIAIVTMAGAGLCGLPLVWAFLLRARR